jgi:DNA replication and repair protein RecF
MWKNQAELCYKFRVMITTLTLSDFRNHETFRVKTNGAKGICFCGPNGAGKTAVLEAASLLCGVGSMRGAGPSEIARIGGGGGFAVNAELGDETEISVSFAAGDAARRVKVDGDAAPLSALSRFVRMVWLTPKEDRLFADSPELRRAFFDRMAASFDTAHAGRVARLSKLLSERAFALKNGGDAAWLDSVERQLAQTAVAVVAARVKYAAELNYFLDSVQISLNGMLEMKIANGAAAGDAEKEYSLYLAENRFLIGDKMNADGAHRTDFGAFNKALGLDAAMTSTGQQKRAVLDLILAHANLVAARTGASPVVLLDEVASHLDTAARGEFFSKLAESNAQVWATGVDAALFDGLKDAMVVSVSG